MREKPGSGTTSVVLVNPNNPIRGGTRRREEMSACVEQVPPSTRVWIDETYVDYVPPPFRAVSEAGIKNSTSPETEDPRLNASSASPHPGDTLEVFAASSENVVVCKSLSKVLALSGARAAYLCGPSAIAADLRSITPPWAVSLPAQVAAVAALKNPAYYADKYARTHEMRRGLAEALAAMGLEVFDGVINSVLCRLPQSGPTAEQIVMGCRERGVFIRDWSEHRAATLSHRWIRIAVKDAPGNVRVIECLQAVLRTTR